MFVHKKVQPNPSSCLAGYRQHIYIYKNVLFYYIDIQNITLPYADDFCLITTDLLKNKKIQNEINPRLKV